MEKILIIDDSLVQAHSLKRILETQYQVEVCVDSVTGISWAEEIQPTLILLDVVMPKLDGFEALKALKASTVVGNVPVILITSLSDVGNEEKGLTLGAVDYIVKPFNAGIVRARVRTHTELYAYRRAADEEFLFVMSDDSAFQGAVQAERIRRAVESLAIPHEGSSAGRVLTVSVGGVTHAPKLGDSLEVSLERVDKMLYQAKAGGATGWYGTAPVRPGSRRGSDGLCPVLPGLLGGGPASESGLRHRAQPAEPPGGGGLTPLRRAM